MLDTPSCSNCGYDLSGCTDSSKCPECGRPIVEVLTRKTFARQYWVRYTSKATLFGWPVIDIAVGGNTGGKPTVAKGFIAIGNIAIGGIALGAITAGVVDLGAIGIGVWSIGAVAVGIFAQGMVPSGYNTRSFSHFSRGVGAVAARSTGGSFTPMQWFFGRQLNAMAMAQPILILIICTLVTAGVIGFVARRAVLKNPGKR